jgi:hypothetical protein
MWANIDERGICVMIENLTITKESVLRAAEKCESAREVLKELFPDVFKDEWEFYRAVEDCDEVYPETFLPGHKYQFRVMCANQIGVWTKEL